MNRPIRSDYDSQNAYEDALVNYGVKLSKEPQPDKKIKSYYLPTEVIDDIENLSKEYKIKKSALIEEAVLDWKSRKLF